LLQVSFSICLLLLRLFDATTEFLSNVGLLIQIYMGCPPDRVEVETRARARATVGELGGRRALLTEKAPRNRGIARCPFAHDGPGWRALTSYTWLAPLYAARAQATRALAARQMLVARRTTEYGVGASGP